MKINMEMLITVVLAVLIASVLNEVAVKPLVSKIGTLEFE